jgi:hypothetical protein
MARTWIELDPDGYYWAEEPGFHWQIYGDQLAEQLSPKDAQVPAWDYKVWSPPGSEWLLPKPRQANPEWHKDARLSQHVMPLSQWTFMTGANAREWEFPRKGDGTTYASNKWISVPYVPGGTSIWAVNFDNIAGAANVTFPATPKVVAFTSTTPVGRSLSDRADYAPYFQTLIYPEPDNFRLFGFGRLCLLLQKNIATLLLSRNHSLLTWEVVGGPWQINAARQGVSGPPTGQGGLLTAFHSPAAEHYSCMVIPAGMNEVHLLFSGGQAFHCKVTPSADGIMWAPGSWWVGGYGGQKLHWQAQVVGYEAVNTLAVNAPAQPIMFDLGATYKPTQARKWWPQVLLHADPPEDVTQTGAGTSEMTFASPDSGESITVRVTQEDGTAWVSDGTNHKGGIALTMTPSTAPGVLGAYLAPSLHYVQLRFPVLLTPRENNPLILDDTEYAEWEAEASLRDPLGKRLDVGLYATTVDLLDVNGFAERDGYPIHVLRDANGDGTPDTIVAAAWVRDPELVEYKTEDPDNPGGPRVKLYKLTGEPLLSRCDRPLRYLPQMIDPDNPGQMEHLYVIQEMLRQCGFDVSDSAVITASADPLTGTDIARLPGQPTTDRGAVNFRLKDTWAPKWDDTPLAYMRKVAENWRGWLLFEGLGKTLYYGPDLMFERISGLRAAPTPSAVIYLTHAAATAAGFPNQVALIDPVRQIEHPQANVIRITGKDADGTLTPHKLVSYPAAVSDINDLHFTGEPVVYAAVDEMGVGDAALIQLCKVALNKLLRRKVFRSPVVPLAPWQVGASGLNLGDVFTFQNRGDYLVSRIHVKQVKSAVSGAVVRTRYTGELVRDPVDFSA